MLTRGRDSGRHCNEQDSSRRAGKTRSERCSREVVAITSGVERGGGSHSTGRQPQLLGYERALGTQRNSRGRRPSRRGAAPEHTAAAGKKGYETVLSSRLVRDEECKMWRVDPDPTRPHTINPGSGTPRVEREDGGENGAAVPPHGYCGGSANSVHGAVGRAPKLGDLITRPPASRGSADVAGRGGFGRSVVRLCCVRRVRVSVRVAGYYTASSVGVYTRQNDAGFMRVCVGR